MSRKFSVVIGNPPYGCSGSTAVKFLNFNADLSNDIRLVLPVSFQSEHIHSRINPNLKCIEDIVLPKDTFPRTILVVRQRWIPNTTQNKKLKYHSHPHFEFVEYSDRDKADVFIGVKGGGPGGRVKTSNFDHYADTGHHLLRCSEEVVERLVSLEPEFRKSALNYQIPSLGKHDLIRIYSSHYGWEYKSIFDEL